MALLVNGLACQEMLMSIAANEVQFPRVSEVLDSLADDQAKLTLFVPVRGVSVPIGADPVEHFERVLGASTVRGVHTIASLSKGEHTLNPLLEGKVTVSKGLVNGQKMLSEKKCANGTLIIVEAPLHQPKQKVGSQADARSPRIEDIIAVQSVNCAHCGKANPTLLKDGALFCSEDHSQRDATVIDEEAKHYSLLDPKTGSKVVAISGLFRRRRWGPYRRYGYPYYGGYPYYPYGYYNPIYDATAATVYAADALLGEQAPTSVECHDKGHKRSSSSSGEEEYVYSKLGLDEDEAASVGISLRRRRKKSALELDAERRRREARALRRAARSEKRQSRQQTRGLRQQKRQAEAQRALDRERAAAAAESASSSEDEAGIVPSSTAPPPPPPPPPVSSLRELLITKNLNPRELNSKTVSSTLEFENPDDKIFYQLSLEILQK
jgi:hypothetical protein